MTNQLMINNIAKETIIVLNYFDESFISKISNSFLLKLKELAKDSNLVVKIDKYKSLKEQNISNECKDLISIIYYKYVASKDEQKELWNLWNNNEILYQKIIKDKYSIDNIFKNKKEKIQKPEKQNLPTVIKKDNIIDKIRKFLCKIFNK